LWFTREKERDMTIWPELDTPALRIDLAKMERNLAEMAALAGARGMKMRPHTKTHKMPEIGRKQVDLGAVGLTVAKLGEAEVMARAGLRDLFVCYPLMGEQKLRRLRDLAREANMMTIVESQEGARGLSDAMKSEQKPLDILIDLEVGYGRVGVLEERAAAMAQLVDSLPGLRLRGVCIHEGNVYGEPDPECRAQLAREQVERMLAIARDLASRGHNMEIISCGSTPGARFTLEVEGITEIRPGNYVFYDAMQVALGTTDLDHCALSVVATVVSHQEPGRAVIDAGAKALALDKGLGIAAKSHGIVRDHPGIAVEKLSEEHGWLRVDEGETVAIGDRLDVIPNHACVVTNLFNEVAVTRGDQVVDRWKVAARGMMA
jgi:D-serine deaminase-like pyridoxal phosphate-dependent protein